MKKSLLLAGALTGTLVLGLAAGQNNGQADAAAGDLADKRVAFTEVQTGSVLPAAPAVKGMSTSQSSSDILSIADQYLGADYLLGASTSRTDAFDCSSFTKKVFSQLGVKLPRHSAAQAELGADVSKDDLQVGDLVFFATSGDGGVSHAGIYAGNGEMISAQNGGVKYAPIDEGYWADRYLFAKRV